ncbi:transposase [Microcoleus sp. bin38.metabat.b11b12b14.051]|uniref:IS110 family transposase n=1 Tax=Microcoleus sp. bin38.metabat.b11b12b14.051 TaxID=2742709 RepID=UPI0025E7270B|nr:transposase [Microcoleus sp. bin38.metabat.b11b12b14.051]
MQIIGLDVSKSSISCCLLLEKPTEPRQFYYDYNFHKFEATVTGICGLLALIGNSSETIAVMEPTGVNYQKLWGTQLARAGVEVRLVGHKELRSFREHHLALPDKDDDADALALAIYGWDYLDSPRRFLQIRDEAIVTIRRLALRLAHLNRVQSPIINRARQDLAWQFPEVALIKSVRHGEKVPLLWGWLCGQRPSVKYDLLYEKTVGLGIGDSARLHAARLCDLQREEMAIEHELRQLLNAPQFVPYRKVFARFGFGQRVEAILLSQIYPLENYLNTDGKPEVRIKKGRKSGKPTKRHLSLRRFMKALGYAPSQESSGDLPKSKVVGGSDLCRKALWQWVFTRIEPKQRRLKNDIGDQLGKLIDAEKASGRPVKLVRSRMAAKAVKLLFKELVQELSG